MTSLERAAGTNIKLMCCVRDFQFNSATLSGHYSSNMMDTHQQKTSLSFSIDNILRDDFPQQRKPRISAVSFPTVQSKFGRWPSAPFYRCFAVRYNPVLVRLLPNMQRFGERLQQANRVRELILAHQTEKRADEGSLRTDYDKEEDFQDNEGKIFLIFFLIATFFLQHGLKSQASPSVTRRLRQGKTGKSFMKFMQMPML